MANKYQHNHYVPIWYQKHFVNPKEKDNVLHYLALKPNYYQDSKGNTIEKPNLHKRGFNLCFAQNDLYTTIFNNIKSIEIEKKFFGKIDSDGQVAVNYWNDFMHPSLDETSFNNLLLYMSTQKLRTPKGLDWLSEQTGATDQNQILSLMIAYRKMYCAIWGDSVWQIADASKSNTKFIISDHPITIYNKKCGPRSKYCLGSSDPDIRHVGSHTLFPLSCEKILILTNLSWARNPYQNALNIHPNPKLFRQSIMKITDIQVLRHLNEQEVREINFIIKSRAYNYIAAGSKEWLYPEKYVSKSDWNTFGNGILFMPDPRPLQGGGEIIMGWKDGSVAGFDAYKRRPWDPNYNKEMKEGDKEFQTLQRFKGDFAKLVGRSRRGRSYSSYTALDDEKDSLEYHKYHLSLAKK